jgi:pimeloyl-ACP methyl ester carboxylesterase
VAEQKRPAPFARPNFDDKPFPAAEDLPPEIAAPLAPYAGARPPAPAWFDQALARAPERTMVATPRGRIEALTWGELGKPGLLFVHGNSAHADWWAFIAPFFAEDYRVTAMSLAGMGGSDWRERYSFQDFAEDSEAVCRATGLYDGGRKPLYIGHSFGGGQVFYVAVTRPEQMCAAIIVDSALEGPPPHIVAERRKRLREMGEEGKVRRPNRIYPDLTSALARFRLSPPQPTGSHYIVDYIARHSLRQVPAPEGGEGWTWKFDPEMWGKLDFEVMAELFGAERHVRLPIAHLYGELSAIVERTRGHPGAHFPPDAVMAEIPDSHHHVMIDQPLALVAAIRTLLAAWRI